jgi:hypothetical protein
MALYVMMHLRIDERIFFNGFYGIVCYDAFTN